MNPQSSILFLGDVVPYRQFRFRNSYKTIVNLECPIITGHSNPVGGKIILGVRKNYLNDIFGTNLMAVSIGNNHMLDYGEEGLFSTIQELDRSGIPYFGLIRGSGDRNPLILDFNGRKIALISVVCPTTSPLTGIGKNTHLSLLDEESIIATVNSIRESVFRIILYIHWGIEESSYPSAKDVETARRLTDSGIDIVIGSHAHAPQPVEKYNKGLIAYNLGNFIMPAMRNNPSYFDENGTPQSFYNKKLMPWNRVSWGLLTDMETLDFKIIKYMFMTDRIVSMSFTPLDRFTCHLPDTSDKSYGETVAKHLKKRELMRRVTDFIYNPHIPKKLLRK
jgi:hypothetical protein